MKPIIGIFLGEAAGVGPELIAKLVAEKMPDTCCRPVLIGDARVRAGEWKFLTLIFLSPAWIV